MIEPTGMAKIPAVNSHDHIFFSHHWWNQHVKHVKVTVVSLFVSLFVSLPSRKLIHWCPSLWALSWQKIAENSLRLYGRSTHSYIFGINKPTNITGRIGTYPPGNWISPLNPRFQYGFQSLSHHWLAIFHRFRAASAPVAGHQRRRPWGSWAAWALPKQPKQKPQWYRMGPQDS